MRIVPSLIVILEKYSHISIDVNRLLRSRAAAQSVSSSALGRHAGPADAPDFPRDDDRNEKKKVPELKFLKDPLHKVNTIDSRV